MPDPFDSLKQNDIIINQKGEPHRVAYIKADKTSVHVTRGRYSFVVSREEFNRNDWRRVKL